MKIIVTASSRCARQPADPLRVRPRLTSVSRSSGTPLLALLQAGGLVQGGTGVENPCHSLARSKICFRRTQFRKDSVRVASRIGAPGRWVRAI